MADLIISGVTVPLVREVPISLNYQIADIQEPEKRDSSFSKTLVIHGTKEVNNLFTQIFDVNISVQTTGTTNFSPDFNPNLSVDAVLVEQNVEQLRGKMQLLNIDLIERNDEYRIEYEVAIRGNVGNIFVDIGEATLDELDLSEFDHTYLKSIQINSRATSIIENGSPVAFELGKGYVYPLIDYGYTGGQSYDVTQHFPSIYLKQYIDKIFSSVGWSFSSTFFDSEFFKRLIIPFNGNRLALNEADIQSRLFRAGFAADIFQGLNNDNLPTDFVILWNDDSNSPNFDNSDVYNTSSGKWTVNKTGKYDIITKVFFGFKFFPDASPVTGRDVSIKTKVRIFHERAIEGDELLLVTRLGNDFGLLNRNITSGEEIPAGTIQQTLTNVLLKVGDKIRIEASVLIDSTVGNNYFSDGGTPVGGDISAIGFKTEPVLGINLSEFSNRIFDARTIDGAELVINDALPKEIKQKDILTNIFNIFNLYVESDKDVPQRLLIEQREVFYTSGTIQKWEKRLDTATLQERPMGELDFRTIIMEYQEDKDFFNQQYIEANGETYGRKREDINNDFLKKEKTYKTIFAPTPLAETSIPDIIIPRIINRDTSGNVKPTTSKLRLLHYSGVKTTSQTYRYASSEEGTTDTNEYGFAGHLDDVVNPTLDLSFGVPKEVYYPFPPAVEYTNNNIFNKYHKKFFEQITSPDSRIVTGKFNLSIDDILNLDFRDKFFFNNTLHILNKIRDFDPSNDELTECEFLRLIEGQAFVPQEKVTNGGNNVAFDTGEQTPVPNGLEQSFNNVFNPTNNQQVIGEDNFVSDDATAIEIVGDNNSVGGGSENVSILASSGVIVEGGASNVTVIGTSNIVVTESGFTIVNGVQITQDGIIVQSARVDGGENTVTPLTASTKWQRIEGSLNEVRSPDATSPAFRLDGGENET